MKLLAIVSTLLVSVSAFAAPHPASTWVTNTGNSALQVMAQKSESARFRGMCSLLKSKVHSGHISASWLGNFRNLARDQAAVRQFTRMVPSILITKLIQALGGGEVSGSFFVDDNATSKGNGVYSVRVTVDTGSKSYTGRAIVHDGGGGKFRLMDVEYMGFSGVNMTKREFQDVLQDEYAKSPTKSMPVTALVDYVRGQSDYQQCP